MELLNYGMASSSEPQSGAVAVNDWLAYEAMQQQNSERMNQSQAYVNTNVSVNVNLNVNPSSNSPSLSASPGANANLNSNPNQMPSPNSSLNQSAPVAPASAEKTAHEDEQPENEPYSIVNTSNEHTRRKPGRPPKNKNADVSPICVQMNDDGIVVGKRGRGRPPKSASAVVPPICIQVNEDAVVVPKRRPGRPPKDKSQSTTLVTDFGEMLEDPEAAAAATTVVTPKRKPGRPAKPKSDEPKRKRGRPPKVKPENGEVAASRIHAANGNDDMFRLESGSPEDDQYMFEGHTKGGEAEHTDATVGETPMKRKRGRPPKDKSATPGEAPKRSPPKPKRLPGEPPRKRGRPPKSAKLTENGGITKLQVETSVYDSSQPAGDLSYGMNSSSIGSDAEVFGFGDVPAVAAAPANTSVAVNGGDPSAKRKRGRPPKVKEVPLPPPSPLPAENVE